MTFFLEENSLEKTPHNTAQQAFHRRANYQRDSLPSRHGFKTIPTNSNRDCQGSRSITRYHIQIHQKDERRKENSQNQRQTDSTKTPRGFKIQKVQQVPSNYRRPSSYRMG